MIKTPLTLETFYSDHYEPLALRGCSENTRRLYCITLRLYARQLGRSPTLDDLTDVAVSKFANWREQHVAQSTVNRDLGAILAMWRWAHRKSYVTNWPDVALGKRPKRTPVAWTRPEMSQLLAAAKAERRPIGKMPGKIWWPALLLTLWDTGERIGAVMELTRDRCDTESGWVTFLAEHRKGGRADNTLPIADDTAKALGRLLTAFEGEQVFPWPYCGGYLYNRYSALLRNAGLPTGRIHKFHAIRKSTASHYEAAGGNATELLGHSSRRITKAYLDPRIVETTPAVRLLFRPGS